MIESFDKLQSNFIVPLRLPGSFPTAIHAIRECDTPRNFPSTSKLIFTGLVARWGALARRPRPASICWMWITSFIWRLKIQIAGIISRKNFSLMDLGKILTEFFGVRVTLNQKVMKWFFPNWSFLRGWMNFNLLNSLISTILLTLVKNQNIKT